MSGISMREMIKKAYPGAVWADKVKRMSEKQVAAVFFRLKREGKV